MIKNALIYDIEIVNAVPGKQPIPIGIKCCEGWHDHAGMGVACCCVYDYAEQRYRVFLEDNIGEFFTLCGERDVLVGYNNIRFDNQVLNVVPSLGEQPFIRDDKCYDILREIWIAAGLAPEFKFPSHTGYGLEAMAKVNGIGAKTANGAMIPVWWQQGQHGKVVSYCLNDIHLTKDLFELALAGAIISSRDGTTLMLRNPYAD